MMSEELRSGLYAFDLVQKRAKRPVGVPDKSLARKVTKVARRRCRPHGKPDGLLFARSLRVPVVMTDLDQEQVDKGVAYAHGAKSTVGRESCQWRPTASGTDQRIRFQGCLQRR